MSRRGLVATDLRTHGEATERRNEGAERATSVRRHDDAAWGANGRKGEGRVNRVPALAKTAPTGRLSASQLDSRAEPKTGR